MATADKVVVELQAKTDAYITGIKKADAEFTAKVGHMEKEANELANAVTRAGQKSSQAFSRVASDAPRAANAIKGMAGQTGNLAAQLNDIGVQLAGGTSPFLIAIQQGSQINQVLGQAGAGGAVRALAGAFTSMLNPVSLATFAIIGLGGAAIGYVADFLSGSDKVERSLKEQIDLIQKVADKWGDAVPALKAYADQLRRTAEIGELNEATQAAINQEFEEARKLLPQVKSEIGAVMQELSRTITGQAQVKELKEAFNEFDRATQDLNKAFQEGKNVGEAYQRFQEALTNLQATRAIQANEGLQKTVSSLGVAYGEAASGARVLAGETEKLIRLYEGKGELLRRGLDFGAGILPGTAPAPSALGIDDVGLYGDFRGSAKEFLKRRAVNAKVRERVDDLNDAFAEGLARFLNEFPGVQLESTVRTTAEQWAIYNSGVRPAAKGGRSLHETGFAADLRGGSTAEMRRRAAELGLYFPLPKNDPGHVQLAGAPRGGGGGGSGRDPWSTITVDPLAKFREDPWKGIREKTEGLILTNKELQASYDALAQVGVTAINGIANALADGKIEGEELLQIVLQIVQQLLTMPRIGGAQGGIFGGLLIPGILHKGGVAGRDGYTGRAVSPAVFSGANRYHGGGMAGLRSGEVPAILQRGEMVIPRGRQRQTPKQNVHVTVGLDREGVNIVPVVRDVSIQTVAAYDKRLSRTFGARMQDATARQR